MTEPAPTESPPADRHEIGRAARHGEPPAATAPIPAVESHQPDPMLQLGSGRIGPAGLSLVTLAIVAILVVVFYGLTDRPPAGPAPSPNHVAATGAQPGPAGAPASARQSPAKPHG